MMNFIKKIFGYKNNHGNTSHGLTQENPLTNHKKIIESMLSVIINDDYLSKPVFVNGIYNRDEDHQFGTLYPLTYVWNEQINDAGDMTFSISINGRVVGSMLQKIVPRSNDSFTIIRDELMRVLNQIGKKIVLEFSEKMSLYPSEWLVNYEYEELINLDYKED